MLESAIEHDKSSEIMIFFNDVLARVCIMDSIIQNIPVQDKFFRDKKILDKKIGLYLNTDF